MCVPRELEAEELVHDRVGARVDAGDEVIEGRQRLRTGVALGAGLPPGDRLARPHHVVAREGTGVAGLVLHDEVTGDGRTVLRGRHWRGEGRVAVVGYTRPAAEGRARGGNAVVAALPADQGLPRV